MVSRFSSSSFHRRRGLANLSQNTSKLPEWRVPQQKWQDSPGERRIQRKATRVHIATTSKFALFDLSFPERTTSSSTPAALGSQPAGPRPRPVHRGVFPEGGRSPASRSEEGDWGPPVAARPAELTALHSPHLHGAVSRQAVAAFETLHYHVLPGWLDHSALHGESLTTVARGTALRGASGRAVRHDARPRPRGWTPVGRGVRGERPASQLVPLSLPYSCPSVPSLRPDAPPRSVQQTKSSRASADPARRRASIFRVPVCQRVPRSLGPRGTQGKMFTVHRTCLSTRSSSKENSGHVRTLGT